MHRLLLLIFVCAACERAADVGPPAVAPPPAAPLPPAKIIEAPAMAVPAPAPAPAATTATHAPDDRAGYAAWLAARSPAQLRALDAKCRQDPTGYQRDCGGIGPLHVPYPPYLRASVRRDGQPRSWFASVEAWQAALTPAQRAYVDRHCGGGEDRPSSALCGDNTPLVAVFDDAPVALTTSTTPFAFAPDAPVATDWPTARTPWLALDRDGDGAIATGAELFGDHTAGGAYANGFAALAALDANHDRVLDARDPEFARLVLWADRDGDHASSPSELCPLAARIVAISLDARVVVRCDARANCERERAPMIWRDASGLHAGEIVDVYLPMR